MPLDITPTQVQVQDLSNNIINPAKEDGNLASILTALSGTLVTSVSNFPAIQPVSGTVNTNVAFSTHSDSFTSNGSYGLLIDLSSSPKSIFSLTVVGDGASASSWSVALQGSLDGVNWTTLMIHTDAQGNGIVISSGQSFPVLYLHLWCETVSLGSATAITATVLAI